MQDDVPPPSDLPGATPHAVRKLLVLVFVALLAGVIPFLLLGSAFETQLQEWFAKNWSPTARFGLVIALLCADIVLPVPSSAVCTAAGAQLGLLPATIASTIGLTLGACSGYLLARWLGEPLVRRLLDLPRDAPVVPLKTKSSAVLLVLLRPLPLLAEASVLLAGLLRTPWQQFFWPVLLANFTISFAYAALGLWAAQAGWLWPAVLGSLALPAVVTWVIAQRSRR